MLHVQAKGVDYMKLCLSFSKQKNSSSLHFSFFNPFAPGDLAQKRILKLVEWFSGHCRAIN